MKRTKFLLIGVVTGLLFACTSKNQDVNNPQQQGSGFGSSSGTTSGSTSGTTSGSTNGSSSDGGFVCTPPTGSGSNNCYAPGVGGQAFEYYGQSSPFIFAIRQNTPNPMWSSQVWGQEAGNNPNIFVTDSRFNARVIVKPAPAATGIPGDPCRYSDPYARLEMKVSVRHPSASSAFDTVTFQDIGVDQCSPVQEFSVPPGLEGEPLVVEIKDVRWDRCNNGYNEACVEYEQDNPGFCYFNNIWLYSCFEVELQFATDFTKDIPH